ncbi:MAG: family 20 glycosylhydrolase, partial [Ginsengibacter sp.]
MRIKICLSFIFSLFIFHEISAQSSQLSLMPVPADVSIQPGKFRLDKKFSIEVNIPHYDSILFSAVNEMYQTLNRRTGIYFLTEHITKGKLTNPSMIINVDKSAPVTIGMDESYSITVDQKKVLLSATNTVGALRGLQTLLQLENYDESGYYFPAVAIKDKPRFEWRGLVIDVSRHFIPVNVLQQNIKAMAYLKMNVLHLHLSDDQGFRVESKLFPE